MYLNVTEVESALIALASAHSSICELITLPNPTVEGRTSHAVRLGTKPAGSVDAYYLTGGVHAREWGSCEILVNLATDLCDAYSGGSGVGYGGKYYSAAEVKAVMEQLNVIIFPCVNPDGRAYSQASVSQALWRKNRSTTDSGGDPNKIGVDINRNQDFLWDFTTAFAPGAVNVYLASDDPTQDTYHGHAAQSEPETKNVNFIHDTYSRIRWYVDVHSYSEDILYVWGDDESQVADTSQNFLNPSYNHQRGLVDTGYKEYIPDGDLATLTSLAQAFTRTLGEVRGTYYVAKPGFSLYATSGTNDDYAYSRHYQNPSRPNTLSFTVEWGTEFQPLWTDMQGIITDVSAGLLGLGLEALGVDSFIVTDRDTFSSYEVETTPTYDNAFSVIYDGFAPSTLGVPPSAPTFEFLDATTGDPIPSISATVTGWDLEDPTAPGNVQRISFTCQVKFADGSAFTAETRPIYAQATFAGIVDVAAMELIRQPNPYMVDGPVSWLSTDVRVFQLRPGHKVNASSTVQLNDPNTVPTAPYDYIQALVSEMRGYGNAFAPPFENISTDEDASALELSRTVGGVRVLNFAVAKVRYRAATQDASDVRVFFRTFNTMVSDLSYTTNPNADVQNYRRSTDGTVPLLGLNAFFSGAGNEIASIPYFAEKRADTSVASMTSQTDTTNIHTLVHAGGTEAVMYFGCWLDFNQTDPQFPVSPPSGTDGPFAGRVPVMQLVRGIHQCLVAEVRFQPGAVDPIPNGATPASSDRLAQRNLAIVDSDNPGDSVTHRVQHTLLLKPSAIGGGTTMLNTTSRMPWRPRYDELVIHPGDLPGDTTASIYLPEFNAEEILQLAAEMRSGPHVLSRIDSHTIGWSISGTTYIPIPGRIRSAVPGLLTLQLPPGVSDGQRFTVDVQQHSGQTYDITTRQRIGDGRVPVNVNASARKVLGAFRIRVAVGAGEPLAGRLVRHLAALRYIGEAIPPADRWHPVFERYIGQLSEQLGGLGVDPSQVPASPDDPGIPEGKAPGHRCVSGKVREIFFDCFGAFHGFVLESCCDSHHFSSREPGVERVVLHALEHRLTLEICRCAGSENIATISVTS